jgi:hypothetical protein
MAESLEWTSVGMERNIFGDERYPSPSGGVMVSTIEHPIAAWVHGFVMRGLWWV